MSQTRFLAFRRAFGFVACALCACSQLLVSTTSDAHGRLPATTGIFVDPSDPSRILVRATYGVVSTLDHGGRWEWICPEAVGFDANTEDPAMALTTAGEAVVGTFNGLVESPTGCDWQPVGGDLEGRFFVDLDRDRSSGGVFALSSNGLSGGMFAVDVWRKDGAGWQHFGTSPAADFLALSLRVAPSDPARIYLSGRDGADLSVGSLQRSDDAGETWQRFDIDGLDQADTVGYVRGVDPVDANTVIVHIERKFEDAVTMSRLLVSRNAGASWQTVFEVDGEMRSFAISPDGSQVAIGGIREGLWIAPIDTLAFSKVNDVSVGCVSWAVSNVEITGEADGEVMYVCSDQFVDGHSVAISLDGGTTFEPLMGLSSACAPLASCSEDSKVGQICVAQWPVEKAELTADCDGNDDPGPPVETPTDSCSCALIGQQRDGRAGGGWSMLLLAAALLRRTR